MSLSTFDVRSSFLKYFTQHQHKQVSSSSVIPHEDPTLLFTNAGMNQFKDVFLGQSVRDYTRATTSQKCIRAGGKHNDLENVGHTSRHLTFFEMIGNFSFGDYFKKEAIQFAFEVSTQVFLFPEDRIYPTIYKDDDEAFELWKMYVPASRITRFGEKDNFWAMGDTGPCGPCSELLFDRGSAYGTASCPAEDPSGERFLEFWNIVFMQYNKLPNGKSENLPRPSIDTGAGLERVVSLIQGKQSVFEIDLFQKLIEGIESVSGQKYDPNSPLSPAFRVIADHLRSLSFAIADGAEPSNTDRGYVLRKILRRAVRYGKQLGFEKPFLAKLLPTLIDLMGDPYRELISASSRIQEILTREEEAFLKTLHRGGNMLSKVIVEAKEKEKRISGDAAFLLKDTYGLPFEEIKLLAIDNDLEVDEKRFDLLEQEAKDRSKAARKCQDQVATTSLFEKIANRCGKTIFTHAKIPNTAVKVLSIVSCGKEVSSLEEGEDGCVILDATPFYAEMGGQIGDIGVLQNPQGYFQVDETKMVYPGVFGHKGAMRFGKIAVGDTLFATVDYERRSRIEANHTSTHLLHYALYKVLGEHIRQSGSLVTDEHIRFDFSHHKALTEEELDAVEDLVNKLIRENHTISHEEMALEQAQKLSDVRQFFGEKYGSVVRVLSAGPSRELCGGCHASSTGEIGYFRIEKESSIASGIRRIEAITGEKAVHEARASKMRLKNIAEALHSSIEGSEEKIAQLHEQIKNFQTEMKKLQKEKVCTACEKLCRKEKGAKVLLFGVLPVSKDGFKQAIEYISERNKDAILVLGAVFDGKASLFVKVPKELGSEHLHAGNLLKKGLEIVRGNGGGKAEVAQGSGPLCEKIEDAVLHIVELV